MQTYSERSQQLLLNPSTVVAVQILLGTAPGDAEFIPILPRPADESVWAELKTRWSGRGLRSVATIGLVGITPRVVLKEPLDADEVRALAVAFLTYLNVLFQGSFTAHTDATAASEISELERLFTLPDARAN